MNIELFLSFLLDLFLIEYNLRRNEFEHMKKRTKTILILVILGCFCIGGIVFFIIRDKRIQREEKLQEIASHYSVNVLVNANSTLYFMEEGEYKEFGKVMQNFTFPLEDIVIDDISREYFKVKGTDYFVYYQDVSPIDEIIVDEVPKYYLSSLIPITTKKHTTFYVHGEEVLRLNQSLSFFYVSQTENYYQVFYQNRLLDLKKEDVELEEGIAKQEESEFISVLNFSEVKDGCQNDHCITKEKVKEVLDYFQEKEFYSITALDYRLWTLGNVSLKKGAFMIHFKKENEEMKDLLQSYSFVVENDFHFEDNDQTSKVGTNLDHINSYVVHQNISNEQLDKIMKGEAIEKPKITSSSFKGLPSLDAKASSIAVLNYHFFYQTGESCGSSICLEVSKFREQLQFLKDNQYKTLTMEEYRAWMYGEIDLPARSVLLTIDDGAMGTGKHNGNKLIPLLEEYDLHATLFLISGWWAKDNYISDHLDIESHTFDMHTEGLCSNQTRGAQMLCSSKEQVMNDLKKSIDVIGSTKAFCFPFYAYNDSAIQSVKEAGFQLAFIGGNRKSSRSNDKFKIPRYPIQSNISMDQFIQMIA